MPNSLHPIYEEHTLQSSLMTTPDQLSKKLRINTRGTKCTRKKKVSLVIPEGMQLLQLETLSEIPWPKIGVIILFSFLEFIYSFTLLLPTFFSLVSFLRFWVITVGQIIIPGIGCLPQWDSPSNEVTRNYGCLSWLLTGFTC